MQTEAEEIWDYKNKICKKEKNGSSKHWCIYNLGNTRNFDLKIT